MSQFQVRHGSVAGVLAMVAVLVGAEWLLPDLGLSLAWSLLQSVLVLFLAALAGAWAARRPFVAPALAVWALVWLGAGYLATQFAAAGQASLGALLQANWVALLLSGGATVAGARCADLLGRSGPATRTPTFHGA